MSFHGGLVGAVVGGSVCKASALSSIICDLSTAGFLLDAAQPSTELWESQQICLGVMFDRRSCQLFSLRSTSRGPCLLFCNVLSRKYLLNSQGTFIGKVLMPAFLGLSWNLFVSLTSSFHISLAALLPWDSCSVCLSCTRIVVVLVMARRLNSPQVGRN